MAKLFEVKSDFTAAKLCGHKKVAIVNNCQVKRERLDYECGYNYFSLDSKVDLLDTIIALLNKGAIISNEQNVMVIKIASHNETKFHFVCDPRLEQVVRKTMIALEDSDDQG